MQWKKMSFCSQQLPPLATSYGLFATALRGINWVWPGQLLGKKVAVCGVISCFLIFGGSATVKAGLANANSTSNANNLYNFISGLNAKSNKRILSGQNILQETN